MGRWVLTRAALLELLSAHEPYPAILVDRKGDLCRYADGNSVDTRTAAYMLAIDRVAYDTRMRGIYA